MDKNALLIALSESGRFWQEDFEDLSAAEQHFLAIWELESRVNNGGFEQYFYNSSGDSAFAAVDALNKIGARKAAKIVAQANSVFPNAIAPKDEVERREKLDALNAEQKELLERLDEEFMEYPDDLTELLFDFVKQNKGDVQGAAELGF